MDNGMDRYIGRCLKNWTARYQPPVDGRARLIRKASLPTFNRQAYPLSKQLSSFLNRYSSADDPFYYPRHPQRTGPFTQSLFFFLHLAANHRLAN